MSSPEGENKFSERKGTHINKEIQKNIQKLERIRQHIVFERNKRTVSNEANPSREKEIREKLICRKKKTKYYYYIDDKYIGKKHGLTQIKEMARDEYWDRLLPILETEKNVLRRALKTEQRLADAYCKMHEGKQALFTPDYMPVEKKIKYFEAEEYVGLDFEEDDRTEFITNRGERVRSKSEKIIADELTRWGIPYKYEKPLPLNVNGKIKDFYPDFTAMNKNTGEIRYVEHLGMMDHPNYFKNTLTKLDVYEKNGLLIGRDVILLHESSYRPLNTRVIADYIEEYLT
ncbi:MAG: hypothetical protein K6F51_00360 [Acetatifactor sp.]|nr:hypothetical protein [Acetatifactor sp.]